MLFPSICDVIRNLSGMWKLMFPDVYVRYFDVPQNYKDEIGGTYYVNELKELKQGLEQVGGREITDEAIRAVNRDIQRQPQRVCVTFTGCGLNSPGKPPVQRSTC